METLFHFVCILLNVASFQRFLMELSLWLHSFNYKANYKLCNIKHVALNIVNKVNKLMNSSFIHI